MGSFVDENGHKLGDKQEIPIMTLEEAKLILKYLKSPADRYSETRKIAYDVAIGITENAALSIIARFHELGDE